MVIMKRIAACQGILKKYSLMRKFTLAAMAVIFAVNLAAQNKCTVSGYIRDAATGEVRVKCGWWMEAGRFIMISRRNSP